MLDLKYAFWGCPLIEDSKQYFAFECEQEEKEQIVKQQLTLTVFHQGYVEASVLFEQALQEALK